MSKYLQGLMLSFRPRYIAGWNSYTRLRTGREVSGYVGGGGALTLSRIEDEVWNEIEASSFSLLFSLLFPELS